MLGYGASLHVMLPLWVKQLNFSLSGIYLCCVIYSRKMRDCLAGCSFPLLVVYVGHPLCNVNPAALKSPGRRGSFTDCAASRG